ncbi:alpha/beta hydrolase-fold protein [Sphingobacterium sp. DR205]|uniref:alpha/beta hydrolase n=1 Tax=Sphingobacterium sp. DR205 TaxID=2713573 RepID=UPI0013E42123|nr:alpha/beta hydrolase-fold protein [Sphingobacterium sp. DR205]QIH34964.1 esterase family protein [Sphingobacterium sp. DR205]
MKIGITFLLLALYFSVSAQHNIHRKVYSAKMHKNVDVIIVTPDIQKGVRYKTVYILHGYSGNPTRTIEQDIPNLSQKAIEFQTIYIIPDGNYNSWYVDSPLDAQLQYSTFIGDELIRYIDLNFPTQENRNARGLLGWSMGGYGALHIGVAYPKVFSIIGSSCGAIDFNRFGKGYQGYQVDKVLGELKDLSPSFRIYNNVDKMIHNEQRYILDCGTEDVQMLEMNRSLHQQLTDKNIEHLYIESPGGHDTAYWNKSLVNQLVLFQNYFGHERL